MKGKYVGENNGNWKGGEIELKCEWCGKSYKVKRHKKNTSRFCSRKCYSKWKSQEMTGSGNHMYGISLFRTEKQKRKASEDNKGEKNYFYGKSKEKST